VRAGCEEEGAVIYGSGLFPVAVFGEIKRNGWRYEHPDNGFLAVSR